VSRQITAPADGLSGAGDFPDRIQFFSRRRGRTVHAPGRDEAVRAPDGVENWSRVKPGWAARQIVEQSEIQRAQRHRLCRMADAIGAGSIASRPFPMTRGESTGGRRAEAALLTRAISFARAERLGDVIVGAISRPTTRRLRRHARSASDGKPVQRFVLANLRQMSARTFSEASDRAEEDRAAFFFSAERPLEPSERGA